MFDGFTNKIPPSHLRTEVDPSAGTLYKEQFRHWTQSNECISLILKNIEDNQEKLVAASHSAILLGFHRLYFRLIQYPPSPHSAGTSLYYWFVRR